MARYKYSAIDTSSSKPHIRLLKLHGGIDSEVRGELFHAYLDDENLIPYEAVSYSWDLKSSPDILGDWKIWIGDKTIPISKSAYNVLDHLRYPEMDRIIWIDSICINQGDKAERSHQVQLMAQIYASAEVVRVWLCYSSMISSPLMESLTKLGVQMHKEKAPHNDKEYARHWSTVQRNSEMASTDFKACHKESLVRLLGLPWFHRTWILQEVANARRTQVHCGLDSVPGTIFAIAPQLVGLEPDSHCQAVLDLMKRPDKRPAWWSEDRDLYALMKRFGASEASEDRDHIYALLGMCTDTGLEVDYSARTDHVIRQTIAHIYRLPLDLITTIEPRLETVKSFRSQIQSIGNELLEQVVKRGFIDTIPGLIQQGRDISVTSNVLLQVAGDGGDGAKMLELLLQQEVTKDITTEALKQAMQNRSVGKKAWDLIFQDTNTLLQFNDEMLRFLAVYATPQSLAWILSKPGVASKVTTTVICAAANSGARREGSISDTVERMRVLLRQREVGEKICPAVLHVLITCFGPMWPVIFPFDHEGARETVKQYRMIFDPHINVHLNRGDEAEERIFCPFPNGLDEMSIAAVCGDRYTVQELVVMGYNINISDEFGWTALKYATEMGHSNLIDWLKMHGAVSSPHHPVEDLLSSRCICSYVYLCRYSHPRLVNPLTNPLMTTPTTLITKIFYMLWQSLRGRIG